VSAWIVDKVTIDALVTGIVQGEVIAPEDYGNEDELGRTLWRECLTSVAYRYPNDEDGERPGPIDFRDSDVDEYEFERVTVDPVVLLKQVGCYQYQSCEHPGWEASRAFAWTTALYQQLNRAGYSHTSPGYDEAPLGLDEVPAPV
jgi:hypothetical protein